MAESTTTNEPVQQKPWEMNWLEKPKQALVQAVDTVKGVVDSVKMPWDMDWKQRPRGGSQDTQKAPVEASSGFNMDSYLEKVIKAESSGNPAAKAKTSSATGLAQFTRATWLEQVAKQNKPYTLKDRTDPAKSREILRGFTEENLQRARAQLGREPTNAEMYFYHFIPGKAKQFINADSTTPATTLVSKAIVNANKAVFLKTINGKLVPRTVGEVRSLFNKKMGESDNVKYETGDQGSVNVGKVLDQRDALFKQARTNLLRKTAETEEYGELVGFLSDRRAVPDIAVNYLDANGVFITPGLFSKSKRSDRGEIQLAYEGFSEGKPDNNTPGTLIHELSHAADRQIRRMYWELKESKKPKTPAEERFIDTFNKTLLYTKDNKYTTFADRIATAIDPSWKEKKKDYRASSDELLAFGMGESKKDGRSPSKAPDHIDPSIATEFRILLSQARDVSKERLKQEGR